jgi:hypothetical protein
MLVLFHFLEQAYHNQKCSSYFCPTPYLQLGCALQLMTVRFLGTFLEEPLAVPESVVAFVAEQLGISDWSDLLHYRHSRARFDNRPQIHGTFRKEVGIVS